MKTYHCGMCGRPLKRKDVKAGLTTFSRFTGNRYCPQSEEKTCRAIYERRKKREAEDHDDP